MNKCKQCNAVINPKWKNCLVCDASLGVNEQQEGGVIHERIAFMTLAEFSKNKLAIRVYSELLEKEVWMVSNEELLSQLQEEGLTVYLPQELEYLIKHNSTPDEIKTIHMFKEAFLGSKIVYGTS